MVGSWNLGSDNTWEIEVTDVPKNLSHSIIENGTSNTIQSEKNIQQITKSQNIIRNEKLCPAKYMKQK